MKKTIGNLSPSLINPKYLTYTDDIVNSYLPGIPANNYVGLGTSAFGYVYGYERMGNDIENIIQNIKNSIDSFKTGNTSEK